MKTTTIVTHDVDNEIKKINPNYINTPFEFGDCERKIKVYKKLKSSTESELNDIIAIANSENILLFHLTNQRLLGWVGPKFDIGTKGDEYNKTENRKRYEVLLNIGFDNKIDTDNKQMAFDGVWNYFDNKTKQHELFVLKTTFLRDKIYTNTCPMALPNELSTAELVILFEPIKGKEFNGTDQSYMEHFEKFRSKLNELYQDIE